MRRALRVALLLPTFALLWPGPSSAADAPSLRTARDADVSQFVPQSPAFQALGISPEEVVRPTSPRAFTSALLTGLDPRGHFQAGLALDTSPYLLLYGNSLSLRQYQESATQRLLARTQMSLATAKASSSDDPATRIALGFRLSPWDQGDPRKDPQLVGCFQGIDERGEVRAFVETQEDARIAAVEADDGDLLEQLRITGEAKLEALYGAAAKACRQESSARNWNAGSWTLGLAPTWLSESGSLSDLESDAFSAWTSVAYGFKRRDENGVLQGVDILEDKSQVLLSARYTRNEEVPVDGGKGTFITQDSFVASVQLRLAAYQPVTTEPPAVVIAAEGDYVYKDPEGGESDSSYRISLTGELRIPGTENTYLKLTAGGSSGNADGTNSGFALTSLNFGF